MLKLQAANEVQINKTDNRIRLSRPRGMKSAESAVGYLKVNGVFSGKSVEMLEKRM